MNHPASLSRYTMHTVSRSTTGLASNHSRFVVHSPHILPFSKTIFASLDRISISLPQAYDGAQDHAAIFRASRKIAIDAAWKMNFLRQGSRLLCA